MNPEDRIRARAMGVDLVDEPNRISHMRQVDSLTQALIIAGDTEHRLRIAVRRWRRTALAMCGFFMLALLVIETLAVGRFL